MDQLPLPSQNRAATYWSTIEMKSILWLAEEQLLPTLQLLRAVSQPAPNFAPNSHVQTPSIEPGPGQDSRQNCPLSADPWLSHLPQGMGPVWEYLFHSISNKLMVLRGTMELLSAADAQNNPQQQKLQHRLTTTIENISRYIRSLQNWHLENQTSTGSTNLKQLVADMEWCQEHLPARTQQWNFEAGLTTQENNHHAFTNPTIYLDRYWWRLFLVQVFTLLQHPKLNQGRFESRLQLVHQNFDCTTAPREKWANYTFLQELTTQQRRELVWQVHYTKDTATNLRVLQQSAAHSQTPQQTIEEAGFHILSERFASLYIHPELTAPENSVIRIAKSIFLLLLNQIGGHYHFQNDKSACCLTITLSVISDLELMSKTKWDSSK